MNRNLNLNLQEVMYRIGFYPRFKDRKGREFFLQNLKEELNGVLLALEMANIADNQPVISVEELVVLNIGGDVKISSGGNGITDQKAAGAPAQGYLLHLFPKKYAVLQ